jgi:hypothetical protein
LPVSAVHSHLLVNEPLLRFNINGLVVAAGVNTMKNVMFKRSLKKYGHILPDGIFLLPSADE